MSNCRSCGARIMWHVTSNGKRMPLDYEPSADGNVCVFECAETGTDMCRVLTPIERETWDRAADGDLHKSHFATCPNAAQHRSRA